jgi:CubicO group peptidase (beta-lactamase class C family)
MDGERMTRRTALKRGLCSVAAGVAAIVRPPVEGFALLSEDEITQAERQAMAEVAIAFMKKYNVPGFSVAIARNGRSMWKQCFGLADRDTREQVSSSSLFRIASVTKPITSVAIFTLIEQGRLNLSDKVFGKGSIFGTDYGTPPYRQYVGDITLDHLLTHTCGGWQNDVGDPMLRFPEMDQAQLISWTLDHVQLDHRPGEHWAYSNFGYCVLGRVIEKTTHQSYRDYVHKMALLPCGVTDMRIAASTRAQRPPNEVMYYDRDRDPYGVNLERADSCGGWIATPSDLVDFLTHVGFSGAPSLLKRGTIATMMTPCPVHPGYARGWFVDKSGDCWHDGGLPGTASTMERTTKSVCWAALANTECDMDLNQVVRDMVQQVRAWRVGDSSYVVPEMWSGQNGRADGQSRFKADG